MTGTEDDIRFAVTQQSGRFRTKADIPRASRAYRCEVNDPRTGHRLN
jgi:hypothetical protein